MLRTASFTIRQYEIILEGEWQSQSILPRVCKSLALRAQYSFSPQASEPDLTERSHRLYLELTSTMSCSRIGRTSFRSSLVGYPTTRAWRVSSCNSTQVGSVLPLLSSKFP